MTPTDSVHLPQYQCHKKVRALKIKEVQHKPNPDPESNTQQVSYGAIIVPDDERYAPFEVPPHYVLKHDPKPGGYYVLYEDGYQSYSPAEAFESGYTLIQLCQAKLRQPEEEEKNRAATELLTQIGSSIEDFDAEIGRKRAREKAIEQMYELRTKLARGEA
jgi:hypothetical protein